MSSDKIQKCTKFLLAPLNDPNTNQPLNIKDKQYLELVNECQLETSVDTITTEHCNFFLKDPSTNSISNQPITKEELRIFHQKCGFPASDSSQQPSLYQTEQPSGSCDLLNEGDKEGEIFQEKIQVVGSINPCKLIKVDNSQIPNYWKNIRLWMIAQLIYIKRLTPDEQNILFLYSQGDSFKYNQMMRKQITVCQADNLNDYANNLSLTYKLIMNAPKTPRMLVFRGENINISNNYLINQGKEYKNYGFVSTSLDSARTLAYGSFLLQIEIPSGTPGIFISFRDNLNSDADIQLVLPPSVFEFKGFLPKWGGPIDPTFSSSLNEHPASYLFKWKQVLPLQYAIPDLSTRPTIEQLINLFADYFKKYIFDTTSQYTWAIKGGYGINTLLKEKFNYTNLIPTTDLDVVVYYDTHSVSVSDKQDIIIDVKHDLQQFCDLIISKYHLNQNILYFNQIQKSEDMYIFHIKYSYCDQRPEDIIDIAITGINGGFPKDYIDQDISKKTGLPIKTTIGYYKELKDVLLRENIKGRDPDTYSTRNLQSNIKGRKTIIRSNALCSVDKAGRTLEDYDRMCRLLEHLDINTLIFAGQDKVDKLFRDFESKQNFNLIEEDKYQLIIFKKVIDAIQHNNIYLATKLLKQSSIQLNTDFLNEFIDKGIDSLATYALENGVLPNNKTLNTAIRKKKNEAFIRLLLDKGAIPNSQSLILALGFNRSVLQLLLDKGPTPDSESLDAALELGLSTPSLKNILKLLLDKGATPTENTIRLAKENDYDDSVIQLLRKETTRS